MLPLFSPAHKWAYLVTVCVPVPFLVRLWLEVIAHNAWHCVATVFQWDLHAALC